MMLTLIVLVLVGVITFFHYVQGLFSATLSAMLAVICAVVAFAFHEPLVRLLQGRFPDHAHAIALVVVFAACYALLRFLFDKYIPGNVQVPLLVDKVGAAFMGLVAAIFSVGIGVIAAQTLPFGPSIGGYSRFAVSDATMVMPNKEEGPVRNALKSDTIKDEDQTRLLIPVDDLVVNTVYHLSNGGALASGVPLIQAHPNYLDELFFHRLGIQAGAKHVAVNTEKDQQVGVQGIWTLTSRPEAVDTEKSRPQKLVFQNTGDILLVVRIVINAEAADADQNVRVGPAGVRLVGGGRNFQPIGTMDYQPGKVRILLNRPDDFLVAPGGAPIDFVFQVPKEADVLAEEARNAPLRTSGNVFIEAKRMGYVDLANREIQRVAAPPPLEKSVYRKYQGAAPLPVPTVETRSGASADSPFETVGAPQVSTVLVTSVNVGALNSDSQDVSFPSGSGTLRQKKFSKLQVRPENALAELGGGDNPIGEIAVPAERKAVQIPATTKAENRWLWADKLAQIELVDSAGGSHKVNGAWGKVLTGDAEERLVAAYDENAPITRIPRFDNGPANVGLIFVVPAGVTLTELKVDGKTASTLSLAVP